MHSILAAAADVLRAQCAAGADCSTVGLLAGGAGTPPPQSFTARVEGGRRLLQAAMAELRLKTPREGRPASQCVDELRLWYLARTWLVPGASGSYLAPPAPTNLALGQPTAQSSSGWGSTDGGRAVDGNTTTAWGGSSCTHTQNGNPEWWQVDLGGVMSVTDFSLYHRTDCCQDRLVGARIMLSSTSDYDSGVQCYASTSGGNTAQPEVGSCNGAVGQFITVAHQNDHITICEFEVSGGFATTTPGAAVADAVWDVSASDSGSWDAAFEADRTTGCSPADRAAANAAATAIAAAADTVCRSPNVPRTASHDRRPYYASNPAAVQLDRTAALYTAEAAPLLRCTFVSATLAALLPHLCADPHAELFRDTTNPHATLFRDAAEV